MDEEGAGARRAAASGLEAQGPWPRGAGSIGEPVPYSLVVLPDIWMMHLESRLISRELKGRTRTATFTEAPAISAAVGGHSEQQREPRRARETPWGKGDVNEKQRPKRQERYLVGNGTPPSNALGDACCKLPSVQEAEAAEKRHDLGVSGTWESWSLTRTSQLAPWDPERPRVPLRAGNGVGPKTGVCGRSAEARQSLLPGQLCP